MKKITLTFITFAIALSSCVTQRTTPQRADNLPPVYVSLKNILADNGLCDRSLVLIDGVVFSMPENTDKKIDINRIVWAYIILEPTINIRTNPLIVIETENIPPERRPERPNNLPEAQISLSSILADNNLCESGNCVVLMCMEDGMKPVDILNTVLIINTIDNLFIQRDRHVRVPDIARYILIIER